MNHGAILVGEAKGPASPSTRLSLKYILAVAATVAVATAATMHFLLPSASALHARRATLARSVVQPVHMARYAAGNFAAPRYYAQPAPVQAYYNMPPQPQHEHARQSAALASYRFFAGPYSRMGLPTGSRFPTLDWCTKLPSGGICSGSLSLIVEAVHRSCQPGKTAVGCKCFGVKSPGAPPAEVVFSKASDGVCTCLLKGDVGAHWGMSTTCV